MKHWFSRLGRNLIPADKRSERLVLSMADGEGLLLSTIRLRSVHWHNMYFGCCREIGKNCDPQRDEDSIDLDLRIRAGHYTVSFIDGIEIRSPKRIAFDKLTAQEWAGLWPSLDLAMQEHFGFDFEAWKRGDRHRDDEEQEQAA